MLERDVGRQPHGLEDGDRAKALVALQVDDAVAPRAHHVLDRGHGKPGEGIVVPRGLDHDLVSPDPVHEIVEAVAAALEVALHPQGREAARNHADTPSPIARLVTVHQPPRRRLTLVPAAEYARTAAAGGALGVKVGRAPDALGCDDHPAAEKWVLAQFGHDEAGRGDRAGGPGPA